jgi:hypothetical protein
MSRIEKASGLKSRPFEAQGKRELQGAGLHVVDQTKTPEKFLGDSPKFC